MLVNEHSINIPLEKTINICIDSLYNNNESTHSDP